MTETTATPTLHQEEKQEASSDRRNARLNAVLMFLGIVFLIIAFLAMVIFNPNKTFSFETNAHSQIIAMIAAILLGAPLILNSIKALWRGESSMNELAAMGVIAAFCDGQYMMSATIALFMTLAELIEARTAMGARKAIEELVRMTPSTASLIKEDGSEAEIEAKDLNPDDIVRVRPGDNIPGDGVIVSGATTIDQANITGESFPVEKSIDAEVYGGTINLSGLIDIRITRKGADTTLGRVQELILKAEKTRTPITRMTDKLARWYTPLVVMIAAMVFFFTKQPDNAIALLVAACPGAIILSAPTAMVAALSAAARCGVLIKNVRDLEIARNLTALVFDKTGTLTTGILTVSKLKPVEGVDPVDLLTSAAMAEQNSRHPVARAVMKVAKKANLILEQPDGFEEVAGKGVIAKMPDGDILVGRESWIKDSGIDTSAMDTSEAEGFSMLMVAKNNQLMGWVGLEDQTRTDAVGAMDELRSLKIKQLIMMTGDRWSVAKKVATAMRCTGVQAEVLPHEKLEMVDGLKQDGHIVGMIGDGVNDAPALAAGNLSIAMGAAGSDVAIESASIALMNNNLNRIPFLIHLSRQSTNVVRQNLILSVLFILVMVVLAAIGILPAWLAAGMHILIVLVVIFNSARLVRAGEDLNTIDVTEEEEARRPRRLRPMAVSSAATPAGA